ncbi:PcnB tRNA nucleotidyltransferase/poly(A) polymerase [Methylophilaceae bacterium]|jgi:tRNA nucleotidyltransferase (CCA-adding enzyme)
MQVYLVGGAVRDELLGLAVKDKDYVVVGSTPAAMLAAGYKSVGKDFPVFLHPQTHDEYALARTERKVAQGYKGFVMQASIDVTLEEDLARRDLTVNAIAKDAQGQLIDPYKGCADLHAKIFRHVSPAFAEDPVRILRAARLAARFPEFTVAAQTNQLMQQMVAAGEVDALVAERVWQELAKGLMEQQPSRLFEVLQACGAMARILPELAALWEREPDSARTLLQRINHAAQQQQILPVRFAVLMLAGQLNADQLKSLSMRLKVPNDSKELAQLLHKFHGLWPQILTMSAQQILDFLMAMDAIRQPYRLTDYLSAVRCYYGDLAAEASCQPSLVLHKALSAALGIDAGAIAHACSETSQIKQAVYAARLQAVSQSL